MKRLRSPVVRVEQAVDLPPDRLLRELARGVVLRGIWPRCDLVLQAGAPEQAVWAVAREGAILAPGPCAVAGSVEATAPGACRLAAHLSCPALRRRCLVRGALLGGLCATAAALYMGWLLPLSGAFGLLVGVVADQVGWRRARRGVTGALHTYIENIVQFQKLTGNPGSFSKTPGKPAAGDLQGKQESRRKGRND